MGNARFPGKVLRLILTVFLNILYLSIIFTKCKYTCAVGKENLF